MGAKYHFIQDLSTVKALKIYEEKNLRVLLLEIFLNPVNLRPQAVHHVFTMLQQKCLHKMLSIRLIHFCCTFSNQSKKVGRVGF